MITTTHKDVSNIPFGQGQLPRTRLPLGNPVNKARNSALFVFSARAKEAFLESSYCFLSGDGHSIEAFTQIAQDRTLPL